MKVDVLILTEDGIGSSLGTFDYAVVPVPGDILTDSGENYQVQARGESGGSFRSSARLYVARLGKGEVYPLRFLFCSRVSMYTNTHAALR